MEEALTPPEVVVPAYPTLKESWAAMGWYLVSRVGVMLIALLAERTGIHPSGWVRLLALIGGSELCILATVWWLRRRTGSSRWPDVRRRFTAGKWQWYALLPVLVLALGVLQSLFALLHLPNWNKEFYQHIGEYPILFVVLGSLISPLVEEILFRGVLLNGLLRNYRPWVAISQSALLFSLTHRNPAQLLPVMLLGLVIGWLYYRSSSLSLCVAFHALNNLAAFSKLAYGARKPGVTTAALAAYVRTPQYWAWMAAAALVVGGCLWAFNRLLPPAKLAVTVRYPKLNA